MLFLNKKIRKMKFKYLIIGCNSFSGSNFVNFLLKKNINTIGISRSKLKKKLFFPTDLQENNKFLFKKLNLNSDQVKIIRLIDKYKPKYIINFAAQGMVNESWKSPLDWYQTNLISIIKLLHDLKNKKFLKKFIQFSTPEVYGNTSKEWISESYNFKPSTPYASSRAACDRHLLNLSDQIKFPVIFTRTANVYGPSQDLYRIIPKTFSHLIFNKKIYLDGNGNSFRSFIHIDDVCEALNLIIKKGKIGETYHISTNKIISIKKLVYKILSVTKMKRKKLIILIKKDRLNKDKFYMLGSNKLRRLGWKDKINLNDGLLDTYSWINKNKKKIKSLSTNYVHKK